MQSLIYSKSPIKHEMIELHKNKKLNEIRVWEKI